MVVVLADGMSLTAVAYNDYLPISGTLTFTLGMTTAVLPITLLDNNQPEPDEIFAVSLSVPSYLQLGLPTTATITILDDDLPTADLGLTLAASAASVLLGEPFTYTLTLSNSGSNAATAVTLTNPLPPETTPLTIPSNCAGTATFICHWPTVAANSSLTLTYQVAVDGILTGTITNSAMVTAVTADPNPSNNSTSLATPVFAPELAFTNAVYTVSEGVETAVVTLTLNYAPATTVTVHYAAAGGTATPNNDYLPISGTLIFAPGSTVQTIAIPIVDDALVEDAEMVWIELDLVMNAVVDGETAVLTILDNDPQHTIYLPLMRQP